MSCEVGLSPPIAADGGPLLDYALCESYTYIRARRLDSFPIADDSPAVGDSHVNAQADHSYSGSSALIGVETLALSDPLRNSGREDLSFAITPSGDNKLTSKRMKANNRDTCQPFFCL